MAWVRARDGMIFGVCTGIARRLNAPVGLVRTLWLLSALFLGIGFGLYIMLWICLPREDRPDRAVLLGVARDLARRHDLDVGVVRTLLFLLAGASAGLVGVGYLVLYFVGED